MPGPDTAPQAEPDLQNIPDLVINYIDAETARGKKIIPCALDGNTLKVGTLDGDNLELEDELARSISGRFEGVKYVRLVQITGDQLDAALERYYPEDSKGLDGSMSDALRDMAKQHQVEKKDAGERLGD